MCRVTHSSIRHVDQERCLWHNQCLYSTSLAPLTKVSCVRVASPRLSPRSMRPTTPSETGETTQVAVKIRLMRMGKIRAPHYRVVVADSRSRRDGRPIEEIGKYHPTQNPSFIEIDSERAQHWLSVGAQPTDQVLNLLKITGDWQKFKGLPGAEGRLKTKDAKADPAAAISKVNDDAEKAKAKAAQSAPADTASDASEEA